MSKQKKRNILDAIDQLAKAESEFIGSEFLAPVLRGAGVEVRIAGVRCRLAVSPNNFEGWGIFQARSHTQAKFLRIRVTAGTAVNALCYVTIEV